METAPILPTFKQPKHLKVWRTQDVDQDARVALKALQGIVNREDPSLYEVTAPCDEHWLKYYADRFGIESTGIEDPMSLFETHSSSCRGVVTYDVAVPDTKNLALTISGLEDWIPATPDLADKLEAYGLSVTEDLRGRFEDRLSVYSWAKEELLHRCNRSILGSICVGNRKNWIQNRTGVLDYLVANRSFIFHLSAARRDREESHMFDEILEDSGGPGVIMGWHCARDQEKEYVSRAARKGFFVLCSASASNLVVHAGVPKVRRSYVQREPRPVDRVEEKVYLTLYMTDGDASWAMSNLQSNNWLSANRGKLAFNWGLLPLMYDMSPGMLEYYYETATKNDYFAFPSSGAAYTYSFLQGDWYLRYSKHYTDLTGQRVGNMVNWDTNCWWREVENPEAVYREKRMLKPIGLVCGLGGSVFAESYPLGIPKVHASMIMHAQDDCAKKLITVMKGIKERPLFIFAFVQIAAGVYDHLVENLKSLPSEVEILHMDDFMLRLRKATANGMVRDDLYPSKSRLAEPTLVEPGRKDLAAIKELLQELGRVSDLPEDEMARKINLSNWHNLASKPPASILAEAQKWRDANEGYLAYDTVCVADGLAFSLFYMAWAFIRARLNAAGRYANHMDSCLDEYLQLFPDPDNSVLEEIWEMWHNWDRAPPEIEKVRQMVARLLNLASTT